MHSMLRDALLARIKKTTPKMMESIKMNYVM